MPTSTSGLGTVLLSAEQAVSKQIPGHKQSAVLIPVYESRAGLTLVFTERRSNLRRHAGEISFPGGTPDPGETNLQLTALREAEEEIGLNPNDVELVGALPPVSTFITNYAIYPFVGVLPSALPFTPNPEEVEEVLEFSMPELTSGYAHRRLLRRGVPIRTHSYTVGDKLIWGATARILAELMARI